MRWLVSLSLRHAVVILVLAALGALAAAQSARTIPLDVFPEFAPPLVEIQTEAPGLSTPEVESLVSVPIESAISCGIDRPSRMPRLVSRENCTGARW